MSLFKVIEDTFIKQSEKGVNNGVAGLDHGGFLKVANLPICGSSAASAKGYGVLGGTQHSYLVDGAHKAFNMDELWRYLEALGRYRGQNVVVLTYNPMIYKAETAMFNGKEYPLNSSTCVFDLGDKKTINTTTTDEQAFINAVYDILYLPEGITNYDDAFNPGFETLSTLRCTPYVDMSQCTSAKRMFFYRKGLEKLDVSAWDMSRCKTIDYMFASTSIDELDVSKWDVSSLESCAGFITNVPSGKIDTSNWVAPNLNPARMFVTCQATKLDISKLAMTNIKSCTSMFYTWGGPWYPNTTNRNKTIIGLDTLDTSKCTNFETMFAGLKNVILDLSNFDMRAATNVTDMFGVDKAGTQDVTLGENFFNMPNITAFDLSSLSMSENLKQSLINCFDRKAAGQPTLTLTMPTRLNPGVTALTDDEKVAIEAKGCVLKYNS